MTNATPRTNAKNGLCQRLLALGIEVRIRLIEHNQERLAIERARQCDPLALSGRQASPPSPIWVS